MSKNQNVKIKPIIKNSRTFLNKTPLFYSGFCLTDNLTFMFFYVDDIFITKNDIKVRDDEFVLSENSLNVLFDREQPLTLQRKSKTKYYFKEKEGEIDGEIVNFIQKRYPNCMYYSITEFYDQEVNSLIMVLQKPKGKPFGILKTS